MQEDLSGKAIKVHPEELIFESVALNQTYTQQLTLKNNLSSPVELVQSFNLKFNPLQTLKTSNQERLEVEPKFKRLAPYESFVLDISLKLTKAVPNKITKQKEMLFIKSDFFDQKLNITIIPTNQTSTTPRDNSLISSSRIKKPLLTNKNITIKQQEPIVQIQQQEQPDESYYLQIIEDLKKQLNEEKQKPSSNEYSQYLDDIKIILREREPNLERLMDMTMKKEREQQAIKDQKILEILRIKDKQIEELSRKQTNDGDIQQQYYQLLQQNKQQEAEIEKYKTQSAQLMFSQPSDDQYQRIIQLEQELEEAIQLIENLKKENEDYSNDLQSSYTKDQYYKEIIQRYKDNQVEYEQQFQTVKNQQEKEKEFRIRAEEKLAILQEQNTSLLKESRSTELYNKISSLQNDILSKNNEIEQFRYSNVQEQSQLIRILDRISSLRGIDDKYLQSSYQTQPNQTSGQIMAQIERKIEEIARIIKELEDDNLGMVDELKDLQSQLQSKVKDIKQLSIQKEKVKPQSKQIQTENNIVQINDELKEQNKHLSQQLSKMQEKCSDYQYDAEQAQQELQMLMKSQRQASRLSPSTQSQLTKSQNELHEQDEVISRLNAKITSMKINEDKMREQISQFQQSQSRERQEIIQPSQEISFNKFNSYEKNTHLDDKISQYEQIVMEQREKLITLQKENSILKDQSQIMINQFKNKEQQKNLEIEGLVKIKQKYEQIFSNKNISQSYQQTEKVDLEMFRQRVQQLELSNMDAKYELEQSNQIKEQTQREVEAIRKELRIKIEENITLKQSFAISQIDMQLLLQDSSQQKYLKIIQDLKLQIQQNQDQSINTQHQGKGGWLNQRVTDLSKTNDKLRVEKESLFLKLQEVKDDYLDRLSKFSDKYETGMQKLQNENNFLNNKVEGMETKIQYLQQKESRIFAQLEEQSQQLKSSEGDFEKRQVDYELIIQKKEERISDIQRELGSKDKTLQERQDQLSLLLQTLENENSHDQLRQQYLNVMAELCTIKSLLSQSERKSTEYLNKFKQIENNFKKEQAKNQKQNKENDVLKQSIDQLENKLYNNKKQQEQQQIQLQESQEEAKNFQYKIEKIEYQRLLKDEQIKQLKEQIKIQENHFVDQTNQLRKEFIDKTKTQINKQISQTQPFKQQMNQLNLLLNDLFERRQLNENIVINELEKVIQVASQNIEQLQLDLDKSKTLNYKLNSDFKSYQQNQILLSQYEHNISIIQKLKHLLITREEETYKYISTQSNAYNKIMREQEVKLQMLRQENGEQYDNILDLESQLKELKLSKNDIENDYNLLEQLNENQKLVLLKQAELEVDERYKTKNENIRSYFDSHILKILMGSGQNKEKILELGREICALKLLLQKTEQVDQMHQTQLEALQTNIEFLKNEIQQNLKDLNKLKQDKFKLKSQVTQKNSSQQQDQVKQDILKKDKELIKLREDLESKNRTLMKLEQNELNQLKEERQNSIKYDLLESQSCQKMEYQEQILELQSQHIQELEDLKTQYELDLAQAKREINKERHELEQKFQPGETPGEIKEQNEILRKKINEMRHQYESIVQENMRMRLSIEKHQQQRENDANQIKLKERVLEELETTLVEASKSKYDDKRKSTISTKSIKKNTSLDVSLLTQQQSNENKLISIPGILNAIVEYKVAIEQLMHENASLKEKEFKLREDTKKKLQDKFSNYDENDIRQRLLEIQIENETLSLQNSQLQQSLKEDELNMMENKIQSSLLNNKNLSQRDYSSLIEALFYLCNELAQVEQKSISNDPKQSISIEQSQRLVIKSLYQKLSHTSIDAQYLPTNEQDRKVWYVELLDQQLDNSETIVTHLQSFIKKLQIEIQGNLQSAAQIKAASMELAQNTKLTADEIRNVKNILDLIKNDLKGITPIQQLQTQQFMQSEKPREQQIASYQTLNPFADNQSFNFDQLQNQLQLSQKVKKTLEEEIVQIKITHCQELQNLQNQFKIVKDQRDSLLQTNEELHEKVSKLEDIKNKFRSEIDQMNQQEAQNIKTITDNEKVKENLVKTKQTTQKHLNKLQTDLHEWRKTTEENMKLKEQQLLELQTLQNQLTIERDRLKAENAMLRKNEKLKQVQQQNKTLEDHNKQLQDDLKLQSDERKKEMEFWITERATMREMIDQLEVERVGKIDIQQNSKDDKKDYQLKKIKKKTLQIKQQKDQEIKQKSQETHKLKDEVHMLRLNIMDYQQKMREADQSVYEADEKIRYFTQKMKEVELERDLVLAEKKNAIASNDICAQQIQEELNSLRQCFSQLKIERDNLLDQYQQLQVRDDEMRVTIQRMNTEVERLEGEMKERDLYINEIMRNKEDKEAAIVSDLRYMRNENERLKNRIKELQDNEHESQKLINMQEMKEQERKFQEQNQKHTFEEFQQIIKSKEQKIKDLEEELLNNEGNKYQIIDQLKRQANDIKEQHSQIATLYENQLEFLKQKYNQVINDQTKVDHMFTIGQREAVIKQLKKELVTMKNKLTKTKEKNKQLQKSGIQENQQENNQQLQNSFIRLKQSKKFQSQKTEIPLTEKDERIYQIIVQNPNCKDMLYQLQKVTKYSSAIATLESDLQQAQNWQKLLQQQLFDEKEENSNLKQEIDVITKKAKGADKVQLYQEQIKQLKEEIQIIKSKQVQQSDYKQLQQQKDQLQEQLQQQQLQLKQLKEEVARKRDVIKQLKQQKDNQENEANQILQDMEELKDDNTKFQKALKDSLKYQQQIKELQSKNEYLKASEKRLKEEISLAQDKIKDFQQKIINKDNLIKELKDKIDKQLTDVQQSRDKTTEQEKLRDQIKKLKIELDIKENQVRVLKQKVDITQTELEQLKQLNISSIQSSQNNQAQYDTKIKHAKQQAKRYEQNLKKSVETIQVIGKELSRFNNSKITQPMIISELDKDIYKDSVNILGVSLDELEEFVNPSAKKTNLSTSKNDILQKKLYRLGDISSDTLNQDLDQVGNYCMELIKGMNGNMTSQNSFQ